MRIFIYSLSAIEGILVGCFVPLLPWAIIWAVLHVSIAMLLARLENAN